MCSHYEEPEYKADTTKARRLWRAYNESYLVDIDGALGSSTTQTFLPQIATLGLHRLVSFLFLFKPVWVGLYTTYNQNAFDSCNDGSCRKIHCCRVTRPWVTVTPIHKKERIRSKRWREGRRASDCYGQHPSTTRILLFLTHIAPWRSQLFEPTNSLFCLKK